MHTTVGRIREYCDEWHVFYTCQKGLMLESPVGIDRKVQPGKLQ